MERTAIGNNGNGVDPARDDICIATGIGTLSGISGGSSPAIANGCWFQ